MANKLISVLLGLSIALGVFGKANDAVIVSYRYSHPVQTMRSAESDVTNQYILVTDGKQSKFYSPKTEFIDSIESTPEGFEQFNTFKRICYEKKQSDQIPRVDGSFYVTKSNGRICTYDIASATKFKWEERVLSIEWEVNDSTKIILGYECFNATAKVHGRMWKAWFTPEIPIKEGPWKLSGLPGIILEAECEGGQYIFVADGIQQSDAPCFKIYGAEKWEPIKGQEFWQLRRSCLDNPSRNRNEGNVIIYKGAQYEKFLPREIVDYIETDY